MIIGKGLAVCASWECRYKQLLETVVILSVLAHSVLDTIIILATLGV